jgi:predicted metal-binding protein
MTPAGTVGRWQYMTPAGTAGCWQCAKTRNWSDGAFFWSQVSVLTMLDCLNRQFILQNENILVSPVVEEVWHCGMMQSWPYEGLLP